MVSTANSSRGDLREETHRKPLPKIAKNRAELEFGQVMASQNHGASTSLINYRTVRKMVYAAPQPRKNCGKFNSLLPAGGLSPGGTSPMAA